jgi:hypothetical protein
LLSGKIAWRDVVFRARHTRGHRILPHGLNRAASRKQFPIRFTGKTRDAAASL